MPGSKFADRYQEILSERSASADQQAGAPERRGAPRVPVVSTEISVNQQFPIATVDISISGACFLSEWPFKPGSEIELSIAGVFSITAYVIACEMEETDATFLEVGYRVRCRFADEEQGMQVLVLTKEREGDS